VEGCANSDLACRAARAALERARVDKSRVQLLLVATCTPDYPVPSTATIVQEKLELGELAAIDVRSACRYCPPPHPPPLNRDIHMRVCVLRSGFAQAVTIAAQFLRTGYYDTVLVIGSEVTSTTGNLDVEAP
jgi:3-oxoacyl-[acyl-carrier-protein] synthase-3